jgi:hypothetical protein
MMTKKTASVMIFFVSLLLSGLSLAQEDQVIVIEDLSKAELRKEIVLIEQEVYQMFNSNMENEDFHIACQDVVPTGSHRPVRSCEPKFFIAARGNNANDSRLFNQVLLTDVQLKSNYASEFQTLTEAMEKLAKDDPSFAQLVMILNKLNARLAQISR